MAPHSSTLAWKIPWTEEPDRLQSMGSHRVGHDWRDLAVAAYMFIGFPWCLTVKQSVCTVGHSGSILGWEDPPEEGMATHSSVLSWRIRGQRSLVDYSPWGRRESDVTERLSTYTHISHIYVPFLYTHTYLKSGFGFQLRNTRYVKPVFEKSWGHIHLPPLPTSLLTWSPCV